MFRKLRERFGIDDQDYMVCTALLCSETYEREKKKDADQLRDYCAADLRLCFFAYAKSRFSHDVAHL